jgi:hypothetical protein
MQPKDWRRRPANEANGIHQRQGQFYLQSAVITEAHEDAPIEMLTHISVTSLNTRYISRTTPSEYRAPYRARHCTRLPLAPMTPLEKQVCTWTTTSPLQALKRYILVTTPLSRSAGKLPLRRNRTGLTTESYYNSTKGRGG